MKIRTDQARKLLYLVCCVALTLAQEPEPDTTPTEPAYLLYEKSNNTCLMCLIQNEKAIKEALSLSAKNINFYSFCTYGGQGKCCLMQPNGEAYTDEEICTKGNCSHHIVEGSNRNIDIEHLNR